jgi:O-antigen/teichoic acid export membrane protein
MASDADAPGGLLGGLRRTARLIVATLRSRRSLSRALMINLAGGVGIQLTLLVSGVVLARALGPENRGNMALLTLVNAIAWQLGGLGIPFALTYATARAPNAARRTLDSLRGAIALQAVAAAIVAGVVLALLTASRPGYVRFGAAMTVAAIVPTVYQRCGLGVLQGLRLFVSFNVLRAVPSALFAVIAAGLWISGDRSFLPYAAAWALSQAVFAPLTMRTARRAADRTELGTGEAPSKAALLKFGRKSLFGGAPPVEGYRLDQSVVALFLAPAALGYYVAALAFTNLPRFIAQSFSLVSTPVVAGRLTHRAATRTMWRFFWLAIPFYMSIVIVLWLSAPLLVRVFFGSAFAQAGGLSRILLVATALFCARRVLADAARGAGYPGIGSIAELVAFLSVLPLFATFVPIWGLDGVAYALVVSSTIALSILVISLRRSSASGRVPSSWEEIHAADTAPGNVVAAAGEGGEGGS